MRKHFLIRTKAKRNLILFFFYVKDREWWLKSITRVEALKKDHVGVETVISKKNKMKKKNIHCILRCVFISCSRVNPRRFRVLAQRSCPEDSVDRAQHTLSWLCWKSNASVPFTLRDLRGWRPVPFRWVTTIRFELPMRSTGWLSPGSEIRGEKKNMKERKLFIYFRTAIFTQELRISRQAFICLLNHHTDVFFFFPPHSGIRNASVIDWYFKINWSSVSQMFSDIFTK